VAGAMQPDLKARIPAKIKTNFWNTLCIYVIGGSFGYHLCGGLHMEAEYAYRRNGIKEIHFFGQGSSHHGHFQTSSYMANLLWDFPISECALSNIRPFVGVGMGYDIQKLQASNSQIDFHQKWNHFSWQMMAGLAYPIFCNTEVSFEYKFHRSSGYFCNHSFGVGLSYTFDILGY
jgi:opacity protein-like surface antigen